MPPSDKKKHQVRHVLQQVCNTPWAILPSKLDEIVELLNLRAEGLVLSEEEIRQRIGEAAEARQSAAGDHPYRITESGVAVIPLQGVLASKMNMMQRVSGGTSLEQFAAAVRHAADNPDVLAIVLDVDSPGGTARGCMETALAVRSVRGRKPIVAVGNTQMASCAYGIGSAADRVVASPSSLLGSLGSMLLHREQSQLDQKLGVAYTYIYAGKHKVDGNAHEPLGVQARASLQEFVDDFNEQLHDLVAANRGISAEDVANNYGQGKQLIAHKAVAAGLADSIGTLEETIAELAGAVAPNPAGQLAHSLTTNTEVQTMDPRIMQKLIDLKLIGEDDDKKAAAAALRGWYAAQQKTQPDEVEQILADLAGKPAPKQQDKTPPDAAASDAGDVDGTPSGAAAMKLAQKAALVDGTPSGAAAMKLAQKAALDERTRIEEIQARGVLLEVDAETIDAAVTNGTSIKTFLEEVTRVQSDKEKPVRQLQAGESTHQKFADAAVEALLRRDGIGDDKPISATARDLEHRTWIYMAEESMRICGGRGLTGDPDEIAKAALGDPEARNNVMAAGVPFHTPGDFPNILSNLANKTLEAAPQYVSTTFQHWAAKRPSMPDFKPATLVRYGEFGEFPLHVDGDDFEDSELAEDYSWIQVDSYGDKFGLTPKMIVNDDLGAFLDALRDKQNAHDQTLNRLCVNLLTGNVACADGVALFHNASHGNDRAAGNPPSTAELSAMRLLHRRQTGVGANRKLNWTVKRVLIPEDLETTTQQLLAATLQINPITEGTTPVFKGQVAWDVEPMLADSSTAIWYSFMTPGVSRAIVYAFMRGFEKMKKRNYYNPENNCRMFQFEGCFAAAVNNYRGVCRNNGSGA